MKTGGTLSNDSLMSWFPSDAGLAAAAEPAERSDAVAPYWDRAVAPASPIASRVAYCRDHWPPL